MNKASVRVFAHSLFRVARKMDSVQQVSDELLLLAKAMTPDSVYVKSLQNPLIPLDRRLDIMQGVLKEAHPVTSRFILFLMRRYALEYIKDIRNYMEQLKVRDAGGMVARLQVPAAVSEKDLAGITDIVSALTGKIPKFEIIENPSILGGFIVQSDSYFIDASMKGMLKKLAGGGSHGLRS